ncbi:TetR/AcrR family transcriptional regulator [Azospirillum sp. B510]|uniref:TetR/AcrR family transcriptional regulator n=1 Tax=Azospirillum sp. (strain B510) TaxID=137722 RepID=UPI0005A67D80|nr:TetR/AcrR family transcriptional regulator [Azospirillum sp. B510]
MSKARWNIASTSTALVDTAEVLFARHGFEGVSLRSIYNAAGVSNKSAVSYHFGSKDDLVMAIWKQRLPELERRRKILFEEARAAGRLDDPVTLMTLLFQPFCDLTDSEGRHTYAGFFRHALRSPKVWSQRMAIMDPSETGGEVLARLERQLHVPRYELFLRLRLLSCAFCDLLVERDDDIVEGRPVKTDDDFLRDAIDMVVGGCSFQRKADVRP